MSSSLWHLSPVHAFSLYQGAVTPSRPRGFENKDLGVIISMMVLCNANVIIEYDRRRSELPSVPIDMEYDNNRTEI